MPDSCQIIVTREGNPWYPLPADYPELTKAGQKAARLFCVSRKDTPQEFVESWSLFRRLYLFPTPTGQFYKTGVLESPQCHYDWIHDFWAYDYNAFAAPRASAKSTVLGKELVLLLLLTMQDHYTLDLALAKDDMIPKRVSNLRTQIETNPRIIEDFGSLQPPRNGSKVYNNHMLQLTNGNTLEAFSIESRKRGLRPNAIILDDPEFDPQVEGDQTQLMKNTESLIFRQMMPMLEAGCKLMWIGTMVTRRAALWDACMGDDPRYDLWNRRVYAMVSTDHSGQTSYLWEAKWDKHGVARERKRLGVAAFQAECLNNPSSGNDCTLKLHDNFGYWTLHGDKIRYAVENDKGAATTIEHSYNEWLSDLGILQVIDPAVSLGPSADFTSILTVGIDSEKRWFLLDLYLARANKDTLVNESWNRAYKWKAGLIGAEDVGFQAILKQDLEKRADEMAKTGYRPVIWPIKYPGKLSKAARIQALSPRFGQHLIRIPRHLAEQREWQELIYQIQYFTEDLENLPHDDALDSLAMVPYVPTPSSGHRPEYEDLTPLDLIAAGRTTHPDTGLPLSLFIDIQDLDTDLLETIKSKRRQRLEHEARVDKNRSAQERLRQRGSNLGAGRAIMNRKLRRRK